MKLRHVVVATVAASCLQGASAFKVTKLDKSVGKGALAQSRKYGIPTVQEIRQVSKTFAPKSKGLRKSERNAWEKSAEGKTKKKVNGKFAKNEMDAIRAAADANTDPAAPTIVGKEVEMGDVPEVHEDGIVELECPEGSDGMRIHYKWTGLGFPVVNVIDEEEVYTYNALEGYSDLTAGNAVEVELINTEILSYGCAAFPTGSTGARRRLLNTESCYGASDNADCVDNFNCASKNMDATPLENAKKAVARMLFSNENGDWLVCTGWLINGPADKVVFGTAYHCISSQAQAESLQVRFFFDAECGECYGDYATASAIGADIVAAIPETDFTLLTLRGDAPEGTVALGYNVDDMVDGETYYRLHHPGGNVLAYSESVYVHEPPATCGAGWENENFAYTIPSQGGVLSGSSGSALLNSAGQIVGQLKGVCAGSNWCDFGATKHVDGRFSESFPAIAAWLGNSAAPTVVPTVAPTNAPTVDPTDAPTTLQPTNAPTVDPTDAPTVVPTVAPTDTPTVVPTDAPTNAPTVVPTDAPTVVPTDAPTNAPSVAPTSVPTDVPTTLQPTVVPTTNPTIKAVEGTGPGTPGFMMGVDDKGFVYRCPKDTDILVCRANDDGSRNAFWRIKRNQIPQGISWLEENSFRAELPLGTWQYGTDDLLHWYDGVDRTDYKFAIVNSAVNRL